MKLEALKPRVSMLGANVKAGEAVGSWRGLRGKTAERGYGGAWQRARLEHLNANPLCVMCLPRCVQGTVVDHKAPHRGDQSLFWDRKNWQTLCASHHSAEKQREESANK